jgi:tetratricopeptide (TPR) repeat protein
MTSLHPLRIEAHRLAARRWRPGPRGTLTLVTLAATLTACGSDTTADGASVTSGGEDLSMTAMAKKVPKVEAAAEKPAGEGAGQARPATPLVVPKLVEVSPEGDKASAASSWGAAENDTGAPLPKRPAPNESSAAAYKEGVASAGAGQLDAAKQAFTRAVAADPKAYQAEYALGVIADRQGQPDEALQHYGRALRIQPDYEAAAQGSVNIMLRRGSPDAAVKFVEPIAKQWQRNLYLQALWADTLVRADRLDEAEKVARGALKRDERFVPAIVALAKASQRRGRNELGDSMLEQAHDIDANYAEVSFLQAKRFQTKGELTQALAAFRKAVELNPDYADARMALGIQYMASGNYNEALEQFEATAKLVPTLVAAHLNLGDAYRALKRWQDAKREFDKALRMQAELPEAHFNLALLYMSVGNEFQGLTELDALGRALTEFTTYRNQMGSRLGPDDTSAAYMADIQRRIDREKKRIEREKANADKEAQRKARDAAAPKAK